MVPRAMYSLLYISRADINFTDQELLQLLEQCREKNLRLEITGMLLYKDGNFMQLLEGDPSAVRSLYETISADFRHCNVNCLIEGHVAARQFPQWSMGFQNLKSVDLQAVPGYSEFLNLPLSQQEFSANPTRAQELLLLFKKIG
jgi:hypothetical protein